MWGNSVSAKAGLNGRQDKAQQNKGAVGRSVVERSEAYQSAVGRGTTREMVDF